MVASLKNAPALERIPSPNGHKPARVRVLEIIGPAGAGKTTLCATLGAYPAQIQLRDFPDVHKITDAPFFIWYGLKLLPVLLRYHKPGSRNVTRREFAWLTILTGWPSRLGNEVKRCGQTIVLDQGPVYLLAEMREFGPEFLRSPSAERFWQSLYARWAVTIDLVIWLDTADERLVERIRGREQEHVMKAEPKPAVSEFLERYRSMYNQTLAELKAHASSLQVIHFDTGRQAPAEIAQQLLAALSQTEQSH
jgi:adenylate kinase family enzyme